MLMVIGSGGESLADGRAVDVLSDVGVLVGSAVLLGLGEDVGSPNDGEDVGFPNDEFGVADADDPACSLMEGDAVVLITVPKP